MRRYLGRQATGRTNTSSGRRIFLVGYSGAGNLGDDTIHEAIDRAANILGVEIWRYATRNRHDPDHRAVYFRGRGVGNYLRACRGADRVVLGGGGMLKDEGFGLLIEVLLTILVARALRKPTALVAVGVGPLYSRTGRWLVFAIARLVGLITVRDDDSAQVLAELGVDSVEVVADSIFSLAEPRGSTLDVSIMESASPIAVISVRRWFHLDPDGDKLWNALRESIASALNGTIAETHQLCFVNLYWPRDAHASEEVASALRTTLPPTFSSGLMRWDDMTSVASTADIVVAMGYHAVAAAALSGQRVVALPYEPKGISLAKDLGLPSVDVDDPEFSEKLRELLERCVRDAEFAVVDYERVTALADRSWRGLRLALGTPVAPL